MTDQYLPPSPDQHDTAAYAHAVPPTASGQAGATTGNGPGYGAGGGGGAWDGGQQWYVPGQATSVGNPEAQYWAGRFKRQRTLTMALAAVVALGAVAAVGLGVIAVRSALSDPLVAAASELGDSSGSDQEQPAPSEDGATPGGETPQLPGGPVPDGPGSEGGQPIPLPEQLQGLGNALGITDARQIIDLAVANGLMTQEDADKLEAAIEAGQALRGLTG
jgi:hypothetical protein